MLSMFAVVMSLGAGMFDWISFLNQHGIEYATRGPNVARGNIVIPCPFCGFDDPSRHMGISLTGRGWGCLRRTDHRGKHPAKLVAALISCSMAAALQIVGGRQYIPENLNDLVRSQFETAPFFNRENPKMLNEFKAIRDVPSARLFVKYLLGRRFTLKQIMCMTNDYGLMYCTSGAFKGRIIFPVYHDGVLVTWTARTVYRSASIRYKTLSTDFEKASQQDLPVAIRSITDCLLWYDDIVAGGDILLLVEGPFDALKVNVLGKHHGIRATCFFTKSVSEGQVQLLHRVLPMYKRKYILLDEGALADSMIVVSKLVSLGVELRKLPDGVDDPAELLENQLLKICVENLL